MDNKEIINIIPSKDISFKTRSLLSQILSRLELTNQDRLDLEKYITFGGGENLDYVKDNLKNIEYIKDNFEDFIKWKDKILNIVKDAPEEFDTLIEIFNHIEQHIQDAPFEKGDAENSAVLKGTSASATGVGATAIGQGIASGDYSFASGGGSQIIKDYVEKPTASGMYSHAEGAYTEASEKCAHAEGRQTVASNQAAHAEGMKTVASGEFSHAEGHNTIASATNAHAEGGDTEASGWYSHAEGYNTHALVTSAHAEGYETIASGKSSHVEGAGLSYNGVQYGVALGENSHAEGQSRAEAKNSHSEGDATIARGKYSHAECCETLAEGESSHAEGYLTKAEGYQAHAEGKKTKAIGDNTHTEGLGTIAYNSNEHASGKYNKSTQSSDISQATQFSIGIGTSESARKNAFEVKQNGDIYIEGVEGRIQDKLNKGSSVTPDWNANEGEPGFIKNKPFYGNADYIIDKSGEYNNVPEGDVIFYNKVLFNLKDIAYNNVIVINSGPPITLEKRQDDYGKIVLIIEDISNYLSANPIIISNIVTISEIFIPNTIARKSDIVVDPIVWKYICNPLIIEDGTEVPDELYDEDRDWLKYEYPAMYRFYDGVEFKFCAKADYDRLTDSKNQDWYINMKTFYFE